MLDTAQHDSDAVGFTENRAHSRLQVHSLAYIELADENAGLILNISETGIAVQAVQALTCGSFRRMHFRLPRTDDAIEVAGRLMWQLRSRKEAGIEFVDLSEKTRSQIRAWIAAEERRRTSTEPVAADESSPAEELESFASEAAGDPPPVLGRMPEGASEGFVPSNGRRKEAGEWLSDSQFPSESVEADAPARERTPRFQPSPPERSFPVEPPAERIAQHIRIQDPLRAKSRRSGDVGQVARMDFEKPRRWWMYTAVLALVAALGFAAGTILNSKPITRSRIQALTRLQKNTTDTGSAGQNGQADHGQLNSAHGPATAQNPQLPLSAQPASPNNEQSTVNPGAPVTETPRVAAPPAETTAPPENSARTALNRSGPTAYPSAETSSRRSAGTADNANTTSPPASSTSPQQTYARKEINTSTPPVNPGPAPSRSAESREPQSSSTNAENLQVQQNRVARRASPNVTGVRSEQSSATSASKPAVNPANSTGNQEPAQRVQDLYAKQTTKAPTPTSPAVGTSTSSAIQANKTPATPTAPSPMPGGSVNARSQFHGFIVPPVQSGSSELSGQLRIGQPVSSYAPAYPIEAVRDGIEGTVKLDVTVSLDGVVKTVRLISGPAMLASAAVAAVRDWHYQQTLVDGQAVEAQEYVTLVFKLAAP